MRHRTTHDGERSQEEDRPMLALAAETITITTAVVGAGWGLVRIGMGLQRARDRAERIEAELQRRSNLQQVHP